MAITATYETLMRQASMTANEYLLAAVSSIDDQFQDGYAQKHPDLVAAFMQVCASDFATTAMSVAIQEAASEIAQALQDDEQY